MSPMTLHIYIPATISIAQYPISSTIYNISDSYYYNINYNIFNQV